MSDSELESNEKIYSIEVIKECAKSPLVAAPEWILEPGALNFGSAPVVHPSQRRSQRNLGSYGRRQERRHGTAPHEYSGRPRAGSKEDDGGVVEDWLAPSADAESSGLKSHSETVAAFEQWKQQQQKFRRGSSESKDREQAASPDSNNGAGVPGGQGITAESGDVATSSVNSGILPAAPATAPQVDHCDKWDTPLSLPTRGKTSSRFSTFFKPKDEPENDQTVGSSASSGTGAHGVEHLPYSDSSSSLKQSLHKNISTLSVQSSDSQLNARNSPSVPQLQPHSQQPQHGQPQPQQGQSQPGQQPRQGQQPQQGQQSQQSQQAQQQAQLQQQQFQQFQQMQMQAQQLQQAQQAQQAQHQQQAVQDQISGGQQPSGPPGVPGMSNLPPGIPIQMGGMPNLMGHNRGDTLPPGLQTHSANQPSVPTNHVPGQPMNHPNHHPGSLPPGITPQQPGPNADGMPAHPMYYPMMPMMMPGRPQMPMHGVVPNQMPPGIVMPGQSSQPPQAAGSGNGQRQATNQASQFQYPPQFPPSHMYPFQGPPGMFPMQGMPEQYYEPKEKE